LGRRYTPEEIQRIQALIDESLTNREIATRLDRSEAGIRNIRHRTQLKTKKKRSLETLRQDEVTLTGQVTQLRRYIQKLETRRKTIQQALNTEEQALDTKLQRALSKMKDEKPELFNITFEEQIAKIAVELTGTFLKWIVS
jgi:hypothetical protein